MPENATRLVCKLDTPSLPSLGHGKTFSLPSTTPLAHSPVGEQIAIYMKRASGVDSKGSL